MNLEEVINGSRRVSADYHVIAGRAWKEKGQRDLKHSPLVYAALEYRCAVERVVLELYGVMHDELPETEKINGIKSFSGLVSRVHEIAGGNGKLLYRTLKFNSIVSEFSGASKTLSEPSVGKLHNFWQALSKYCHWQVGPEEAWDSHEWICSGYQLISEVDDYFQKILIDHYFGAMSEEGMPPEVRNAKCQFLGEEIDESILRIRLRLMQPVLESRIP